MTQEKIRKRKETLEKQALSAQHGRNIGPFSFTPNDEEGLKLFRGFWAGCPHNREAARRLRVNAPSHLASEGKGLKWRLLAMAVEGMGLH